MQPVGILMREHRIIERMVSQLAHQMESLERGDPPNVPFMDAAVWFMQTYADACHHGKEEKILFAQLRTRELTVQHRAIMQGLEADHARGRECLARVIEARRAPDQLDSGVIASMDDALEQLVSLYPMHIETEDREFFMPAMDYFTRAERDAMVAQMEQADRTLLETELGAWIETWEQAVRTPVSVR